MGGFGKIFFTKGGIKREKRGFGEMEGRSYIFFKSFEGVEENSKFYGEMYFWVMGWGREREGGKDRGIFGLSGRWDVIWNIP